MSLPNIKDIRTPYKDLSESDQEELFALSCFDEAHWEDAPAWEVDYEWVSEKIDSYLQDLFGGSWRAIKRKGNLKSIRSRFFHGDMTNEILSWYLEETTEYYCETESKNSVREFDLQIMKDDNPVCDVGIKRLATSRQMRDYLIDHREKWDDIGESKYALLLNFFPTTNAVRSPRVGDFVVGYGYVSEETDAFYSRDTSFVASIPTPITRERNDVMPLKEVKTILEAWLGESR